MIYFNQNKEAYAFKIENPLCIVPMEQWSEFSTLTLGEEYDVNETGIVDLRQTQEYQEKQNQAEKERIAKLFLTGADVERGIYKAKGMDFEDIVAYVTQLQPAGLDIKALKIELKANNFYRGNPYVVAIGELLGFTEEQLNLFFETNDYTVLLPKEEPTETPVEKPIAYDDI